MHIAIMGSGGIGGLVGARLAEAGEPESAGNAKPFEDGAKRSHCNALNEACAANCMGCWGSSCS